MDLYADLDIDPFFPVESHSNSEPGSRESVGVSSAQLEELQSQNDLLSRQNLALRKNISCLYKTARSELQRKDTLIATLTTRIHRLEFDMKQPEVQPQSATFPPALADSHSTTSQSQSNIPIPHTPCLDNSVLTQQDTTIESHAESSNTRQRSHDHKTNSAATPREKLKTSSANKNPPVNNKENKRSETILSRNKTRHTSLAVKAPRRSGNVKMPSPRPRLTDSKQKPRKERNTSPKDDKVIKRTSELIKQIPRKERKTSPNDDKVIDSSSKLKEQQPHTSHTRRAQDSSGRKYKRSRSPSEEADSKPKRQRLSKHPIQVHPPPFPTPGKHNHESNPCNEAKLHCTLISCSSEGTKYNYTYPDINMETTPRTPGRPDTPPPSSRLTLATPSATPPHRARKLILDGTVVKSSAVAIVVAVDSETTTVYDPISVSAASVSIKGGECVNEDTLDGVSRTPRTHDDGRGESEVKVAVELEDGEVVSSDEEASSKSCEVESFKSTLTVSSKSSRSSDTEAKTRNGHRLRNSHDSSKGSRRQADIDSCSHHRKEPSSSKEDKRSSTSHIRRRNERSTRDPPNLSASTSRHTASGCGNRTGNGICS